MTYKLMERIINNAKKDGTLEQKRADIMNKLDAFYAADRLTREEYEALVALMNA
jgi:hypothetical protein